MASKAGNPKFILGRKKNIDDLKKMLKKAPLLEHKQILAKFALERGLRRAKVLEYYKLLKEAGMI